MMLRRATLLGCIAWTVLAASCGGGDEPLPALEGETIVERDAVTGTVDFYAPADGTRVLAPGADAQIAAMRGSSSTPRSSGSRSRRSPSSRSRR